MNYKHSIALLTCWYGEYPWYFPYFIKSCVYNPSVDFILITDNTDVITNKPDNVKVVYKTLEEFKTNASEKLGFEIVIDTPYKLCDFKPAYGFLFSEILVNYNFWGHGDIDMVYGDIRGFITEELLNTYDILTASEHFTMGTFCLFRNNLQMNTLFMESRDYREVYTNPEHYCFDECNFLFSEIVNGSNSILDFPNHIQSMTYLAVKGNREGVFRVFFDRIIVQGMSDEIRWDNGLIIFNNKFECLFYDLIDYKIECKNKIATYPIPDIFYFKRIGIKKVNPLYLFWVNILMRFREFKERQFGCIS